jgi:hypothetical protein
MLYGSWPQDQEWWLGSASWQRVGIRCVRALIQLLGCRQSFAPPLEGYDCISEGMHRSRLLVSDATCAGSEQLDLFAEHDSMTAGSLTTALQRLRSPAR